MDPTLLEPAAPAFDYASFIDRCMGSLELAERLVHRFQDVFWTDLAKLEQALDTQDADKMAQVAHHLKGSSANMSAPRIRQCAAEVEQLGRAGQLADMPIRLQRLRAEWPGFAKALPPHGLPAPADQPALV
jgi:HPt (histidine-containing phosphotransfer) domain-containing protein